MQKWQYTATAFGLFFLTMLNTYAQEQCATMRLHNKLLQTNPEYKQQYEQSLLTKSGSEARDASTQSTTVYKIPVVVHVLHLGEPVGKGTNISNEQIYSAIVALNEAYGKKAGSIYDGNGVDMGIEFCLAQKNPQGNATSGITRVNAAPYFGYGQYGLTTTSDKTAINEETIKEYTTWDHTKYYNIWVVSEIDDNNAGYGVQGFAYFPGAPADLDGAVMLYNVFGYDPEGTRNYNLKSYANRNITLTHEMGHAFNLYHPFEGDGTGSTCPTEANGCGSGLGDCCADIPACKRSQSDCVTGINPCDGVTSKELYIHNYMDYSSEICRDMFTADQATRARNTFTATDFTSRASLAAAANLVACGCNSNTAPITRFYASTYMPCPGSIVQFYDESVNQPASYNWTFTGGTPPTSTSQNPTVTYPAGGHFDVTLQVVSGSGQSNTLTKTAYIAPAPALNIPFTESFEETTFPPSNWITASDDASTNWGTDGSKVWQQRTVTGSGAGTKAAAMNFFNYNAGGVDRDDLSGPLISLQGITSPSLTFEIAYRYFGSTQNADSLFILATADCGVSYTTIYSKGGATLNTTTALYNANGFAPSSAADWRLETIDLSAFAGQDVKLLFRTQNEFGDNLYLDNINIVGVSGVPVADFESATTGTPGHVITFTNTSTGSITSYSWDFGPDATPATADIAGPIDVTYSNTGSKTISLTVSGPGGTNTVTKTDFVNVVTSVLSSQSLESAGIKVYPNPTKDIIHISAANSQYVSVQVMDILSNTVVPEQTKTGSEDLEVDLSGKPQGIYLLLIKTTQGNFGTRIVKTN